MRILFAASEAYPLIKTGGLADVAGSLPRALVNAGEDLRLVLPAYGDLKAKLETSRLLLQTHVMGQPVGLRKTRLPGSRVKVWLVESPLFDRPGNPYHDEQGDGWPDNALRFALFSRVIAHLALDQWGQDWRPDVLHLNDWQTGLTPVWLQGHSRRPAIVFTIHNLAYQGVFDRADFDALELDPVLWHYERLEYHGRFSFIKGGLVYADRITTVSPHYAEEIQRPEFGHGLDGLLRHRAGVLSGIVNGIDTRDWNPAKDPHLAAPYHRKQLDAKVRNKLALQKELGLKAEKKSMLIGLVGRLVEQKGIDLVLEVLPRLMKRPVQLAVLGSGAPELEERLQEAAEDYRGRMAVHIGYNEGLAHRVEAGSDAFLMPSRFEPCGLNQMYSQRYGTLPIVTPVGGLIDTVVDEREGSGASGFVMPAVEGEALLQTVERALVAYADKPLWARLQHNAMSRDFSWQVSARAYLDLYGVARADRTRV